MAQLEAPTSQQTSARSPAVLASRRSDRLRRALSFRSISAIYVFAFLFVVYSIWEPGTFLTTATLDSLLSEQALVAMVAVGLVVPLAAGVFDLSIGAMVGIGCILVSWLMVRHGFPVIPAMVISIAAGTLVGLANAMLVNKVGINLFIATLGMSSLLIAAAEWITGNLEIVGVPPSFASIANNTILGITLPVYMMFILAIIIWYVLDHTPMGRWVYATGGNLEAARLSGVPTTGVIACSLVVGSTVAAFAGVLLASQIQTAAETTGQSFLLPAFAAVFLGSTQIKNGSYNVWGTVIAVYVLATGVQGLLLAGAPLWLPDFFNGAVLILAVGLSIRRNKARIRATERDTESVPEDGSLAADGS